MLVVVPAVRHHYAPGIHDSAGIPAGRGQPPRTLGIGLGRGGQARERGPLEGAGEAVLRRLHGFGGGAGGDQDSLPGQVSAGFGVGSRTGLAWCLSRVSILWVFFFLFFSLLFFFPCRVGFPCFVSSALSPLSFFDKSPCWGEGEAKECTVKGEIVRLVADHRSQPTRCGALSPGYLSRSIISSPVRNLFWLARLWPRTRRNERASSSGLVAVSDSISLAGHGRQGHRSLRRALRAQQGRLWVCRGGSWAGESVVEARHSEPLPESLSSSLSRPCLLSRAAVIAGRCRGAW